MNGNTRTVSTRPRARTLAPLLIGVTLLLLGPWLVSPPPSARADLGDDFSFVGTISDPTYSVAWGDWDGDGDLDLAVGNYNQVNQVFENVGGSLVLDPGNGLGWESAGHTDYTSSVAWGDWDGDGDLDLAVGNYGDVNQVFENVGGSLVLDPGNGLGWESTDYTDDWTWSVAWGDWDGDGDLDLATGNWAQVNRVFENEGGNLGSSPAWESGESLGVPPRVSSL